jgi:hypothetical protein
MQLDAQLTPVISGVAQTGRSGARQRHVSLTIAGA